MSDIQEVPLLVELAEGSVFLIGDYTIFGVYTKLDIPELHLFIPEPIVSRINQSSQHKLPRMLKSQKQLHIFSVFGCLKY